jgi:hypothetical protein
MEPLPGYDDWLERPYQETEDDDEPCDACQAHGPHFCPSVSPMAQPEPTLDAWDDFAERCPF